MNYFRWSDVVSTKNIFPYVCIWKQIIQFKNKRYKEEMEEFMEISQITNLI